jgi:hypothetical protein
MAFGKRITSLGPSAREGDRGGGKPNKYRKTLNGNFIKHGGGEGDNNSFKASGARAIASTGAACAAPARPAGAGRLRASKAAMARSCARRDRDSVAVTFLSA